MSIDDGQAVAGLGLPQHEFGLGDAAGVQLRRTHRRDTQGNRAHDPHGAGFAVDQTGDGGPQALRVLEVVGLLVCLGHVFHRGNARPHGHAAEDGQQCRQQGEAREDREDHADSGDRAQRAVGFQHREQQAQQTGNHGGAGGQDRGERTLPGHTGGLPAGCGLMKGFAEPGGVQQAVVRGGADHDNRENALGLAAQGDELLLGHPVHGQNCTAQGRHGGEQHQDGQDG